MKKKLLLILAFILVFGGGIWLGVYIRSQTINPQATLPNVFERILTFFVIKPEDKNIKARELGVTHYVDDETGVLEKLVDVKNRFLFDNLGAFSAIGGFASGEKNIHGYTRVELWKELVEYFLI